MSTVEVQQERSARPTLRVQIQDCEHEIAKLQDEITGLEAQKLEKIRGELDTTAIRNRLSVLRVRLDEAQVRLGLLRAEFKEKIESRLGEVPGIESEIKDRRGELWKVGAALAKHLGEAARMVGSFDKAYGEVRSLDERRSRILEGPSHYFVASPLPPEIRSALAPNVVARFQGIVERFKGGG